MNTITKRILALLFSLILMLSFVACTSNGQKETDEPSDLTGIDSLNGETESELSDGFKETVAIAMYETPTSLDPQVGDLISNKMIWNCTHNSLLGIDKSNNTIIPELAKKYEISEDLLTYTFYLNEGVIFHNGEEMKSSDVVFTFERASTMPDVSPRIGMLDTVTAIDEYTVEMKLNAVNLDWDFVCADQLFSILSEKACTDDNNGAAIGTGRFRSTHFAQNERVSLERFDECWLGAAPTKYIDFRVLPDSSTRLVALQNGEVDVCLKPSNNELDIIANDKNLELVQFNGAVVSYIAFNSADEISGNELIRQAIASAIDREVIISAALDGNGATAQTMWGPNVYGYDASVTTFESNIESASSLLAKAGYPDGVELEVVCEDEDNVLAQMVQDQVKAAGIKIKIKTMDMAGFYTYREHQEDQMSLNKVAYAPNADDMRWSFGSDGAGNFGRFTGEYDNLLDTVASVPDEVTRLECCTKIQNLNAKECWYIPVYATMVSIGINKNVSGIEYELVEYHDFSEIMCTNNQ